MNGFNAAAMALQAALGNPALQPLLMAQNPWLASQMLGMGMPNPSAGQLGQLGQIPTSAPGPVPPPLDPAALAAAAQFGQQLGAAAGKWLGTAVRKVRCSSYGSSNAIQGT